MFYCVSSMVWSATLEKRVAWVSWRPRPRISLSREISLATQRMPMDKTYQVKPTIHKKPVSISFDKGRR
jgi:hypothetical protein